MSDPHMSSRASIFLIDSTGAIVRNRAGQPVLNPNWQRDQEEIQDRVVAVIDSDRNIRNNKIPESAQEWINTCEFSASGTDTVNWASGTITLSGGAEYAIDAGTTGTLSALTYIYFDTDESETELQITEDPTEAVGFSKTLIAIAQDGDAGASFFVFNGFSFKVDAADVLVATTIVASLMAIDSIEADSIVANSVITEKINDEAVILRHMTEEAVGADIGYKSAPHFTVSASGTADLDLSSIVPAGYNKVSVALECAVSGAGTYPLMQVYTKGAGGYNSVRLYAHPDFKICASGKIAMDANRRITAETGASIDLYVTIMEYSI
jgi:hypothetical protein